MDEDAARKVAVSIAQRAAMRVFPYVWEWSVSENSTEVDVTSLPVLRCLLIAASSCFEMTRQSKKIAHSAADLAFRKYKTDWSSYFALNAHPAGADAAAYASFTSSDVSQLDVIKLASSAVDPIVDGKMDGIWAQVLSDVVLLEPGNDLPRTFLWTDKAPDWFQALERPMLEAWRDESLTWSFWARWWDGAKNGTPLDWDLQTEVALIEEHHNLREENRALKEALSETRALHASALQRSHNQPPELIEDEVKLGNAITLVWNVLDETEEELEKHAPDPARLQELGAKFWAAFKIVMKYFGSKADKMIDKSSEVIAETGTKWVIRVWAASIVSQQPAVQSLSKGLIEFGKKYFEAGP